MKKFIILLLTVLTACSVGQPTQVPGPDTEAEVAGLQDIPLTNMPGHAPPEIPLECVCPKMFGLDHNPCCPTPKPATKEGFVWYTSPAESLIRSKGEKTVLILFTEKLSDAKPFLDSLQTPCARKVLDEHYVGLLVGRELYDGLRETSALPLRWYPGDYFMSPSVMFAHTEKAVGYGEGVVLGYALPITFEGPLSADTCDLLKGMHTANR